MRRDVLASLASLGVVLLVAACAEQSRGPTNPEPSFQEGAPPLPCNQERTLALTKELFVKGPDRTRAQTEYFNTSRLAGRTPPGTNPAATRSSALNLVRFTLDKFQAGELIGGSSEATLNGASEFMTNILCLAALPPFDPAALDEDGAAEVVMPDGPPTTIVTETGFAATHIETGSVTEPTLITIRRLPDVPGPLLTQLDQYPIFYEFDYNPATTFEIPVVVVVCTTATITPPDPGRLRLGHNIAPYTMGSIEILTPVEGAEFVNCTEAGLSAAPSRGRLHDLARGGFNLLRTALSPLAPQPLFAAPFKGTGGLSGSVRTFSPFGGVDTLGQVGAESAVHQSAAPGALVAEAPTVKVRAPSGRNMAGIEVRFTVVAGNGTLGVTSVLTDATGHASAGSWRIGSGENEVRATVHYTPGSGFYGAPVRFHATGVEP